MSIAIDMIRQKGYEIPFSRSIVGEYNPDDGKSQIRIITFRSKVLDVKHIVTANDRGVTSSSITVLAEGHNYTVGDVAMIKGLKARVTSIQKVAGGRNSYSRIEMES